MGGHKIVWNFVAQAPAAKPQGKNPAETRCWQSYFDNGVRLLKAANENPRGKESEQALKTAHWNFSVALRKGATDYKIYELLGDAQHALGRWDAALENYAIAFDFDPGNAKLCCMLGDVHLAFAMGSDNKRNMSDADYHYYWAENFYKQATDLDIYNKEYSSKYKEVYKQREAFFDNGKGFLAN